MDLARVLFFRALADETRQEILELLSQCDEMCVQELCERLAQLSQQTVSHHLQILKHSEVVRTRKQGKFIYYQINRRRIGDMGQEFLMELKIWRSE